VAKQSRDTQLREFALIGARARLQELRDEQTKLREVFPELFRSGRAAAENNPEGRPRRRRRRMSAAQRKAVSERMRKYWADRRKKG
jgi:hypothetical protein